MSIEKALIAQSGPHILMAKVQAILTAEIAKGCRKELSPDPVALEPQFWPITTARELFSNTLLPPAEVPESVPEEKDLFRLQVWMSPQQKFEWRRAEIFLKMLQKINHRAGWEIMGNAGEIRIGLFGHREDLPIIRAAFGGQFPTCELAPPNSNPYLLIAPETWEKTVFLDFFPPPPYSHLFTRPDELHNSPLESLFSAMAQIPEPVVGIYQLLFQPVHPTHDWHRNIQILQDLEYTMKLMSGHQLFLRMAQQPPSGSLNLMAQDLSIKAHQDKPLFAAAFRVAVVGAGQDAQPLLQSLATFTGLFQHGGRPLEDLTEQDYQAGFSTEQLCRMFTLGLTYRPGFLLNSWELTGPVHIPPVELLENRAIQLKTLEFLPIQKDTLSTGTPIGTCDWAGTVRTICLPANRRKRHCHIIGKSDMGKSTAVKHMILDDIKNGAGVAVIDPHGDLVEDLLYLIEENDIERTIWFDPGNPDWVPIWNPMQRVPGQDIGRTADDLVGSFKSFVTGWGDRMEHLLRCAFNGLIPLGRSTFLDVLNLLRHPSSESDLLRQEILKVTDNEIVRQFCRFDYKSYANNDYGPPRHKLSRLLGYGTLSLMLSQPNSSFSLRRIMDDGMILLVNLADLGSEVRNVMGCFVLSLLYLTALSRSDTPPSRRKAFHSYCDEAHRFMTDSLEDLLTEARKFNVSLTLAHQYLKQFESQQADALATVGSTLIFNVDSTDANRLVKDLRELVEVNDIVKLDVGDAILRCGTEVVKIRTFPPPEIPANHHREKIIRNSYRRYYKSVPEVREMICRRNERWNEPFSPLTPPANEAATSQEELNYDEFSNGFTQSTHT